jgi:fumarate reductase subunit D
MKQIRQIFKIQDFILQGYLSERIIRVSVFDSLILPLFCCIRAMHANMPSLKHVYFMCLQKQKGERSNQSWAPRRL